MGLSDRAVIHFINGMFGTRHPLNHTVTRPSTETVDTNLRHSQPDMVIVINGCHSYLIEAQISDDEDMGVRIFRYIMNEGQRNVLKQDHILRLKLPDARVIYWETIGSTADKEIISFELSSGGLFSYEAPSFKFPKYTVAMLEKRNMGILLPFCVLKLRGKVKRAKNGAVRRGLAKQMKRLLKDIIGAAERSEKQGKMSRGDLDNVIRLTQRLHDELYSQYTEFKEDKKMWEDIKLIDYDGMYKAKEEARQAKKEARQAKKEAALKAEKAVLKLREMGISEEQLVAAGLLEIARK
jgi:hypothetical protein